MKKELAFNKYGNAFTTTKSGAKAGVWRNDTNINKVYYRLVVDGKTIFTRGSLNKVFEKLEEL